jgi:hypothetical protein
VKLDHALCRGATYTSRGTQVSPTSASTSYSLVQLQLQQAVSNSPTTLTPVRSHLFRLPQSAISRDHWVPIFDFTTLPPSTSLHGPRTTIHDSTSPWTKPSARPPPTSHAFVRTPPGPPAAVPQCCTAELLLLLAPVPPAPPPPPPVLRGPQGRT